MTIGVLFVSMGGICRAPMAAGVFRVFAQRGRIEHLFEIAGAGTFDGHAGQPPSLLASEVARARGYDIGRESVRVLRGEDLARFDHGVAMDRSTLATMRWMAPAGCTDRPQLLMRHAPQAGATDIADPYGGTAADYERALDLIEKGCAGLMMTIVRTLQGPGERPPGRG
jgi:protein-tyrosine phosphatase